MIKLKIVLLLTAVFLSSCRNEPFAVKNKKVILGDEQILSEQFNLIKNKRIGIITNQSGILSNGTNIVDTLVKIPNVNLAAIFSPEHGFRGNVPNGVKIGQTIDSATGLPVYSLYGKIRKPTPEMLKTIDVLLFDIQDIGARYYTYISTLYYAIQSAAENNVKFIVLDRPNPISGIKVEGPVLDTSYQSFVGIAAIPIMHGMTVGELAKLFNNPDFLKTKRKADLTIVKMKNWKRKYFFNDCRIKWIKPSPNIVSVDAELVYPGMCLLEGTNVSEGRGTYQPFIFFGAPFINSTQLLNQLKLLDIKGVQFYPAMFTPKSIPHMSMRPKYKGKSCFGLKIVITDRNQFEPVKFGVKLLYALNKTYPGKFRLKTKWLDKLYGSSKLSQMLIDGKEPKEIISTWNPKLSEFIKKRKRYLLYN